MGSGQLFLMDGPVVIVARRDQLQVKSNKMWIFLPPYPMVSFVAWALIT